MISSPTSATASASVASSSAPSSSSGAPTTPTSTILSSLSNINNSSNKMHLYQQSHKDSNGSSSRNSSSYSYDSENSSLLTNTSSSSPIKRQATQSLQQQQQQFLQSEINKATIRRTDSNSGIQSSSQHVVDAAATALHPKNQFHPIMKSMSDSVSPSDIIAGHHYQPHGKYVKRIGSGANEIGKSLKIMC